MTAATEPVRERGFALRDVVHAVLDSSDEADATVIADLALARLSAAERDVALAQTMRSFVRLVISQDRGAAPRVPPSAAGVYYDRKSQTEGRVHAGECRRCGPSGQPAPTGSPWSDAHRHADALRVLGKELLKDLWLESRRLHQEAARENTSQTHRNARREELEDVTP